MAFKIHGLFVTSDKISKIIFFVLSEKEMKFVEPVLVEKKL